MEATEELNTVYFSLLGFELPRRDWKLGTLQNVGTSTVGVWRAPATNLDQQGQIKLNPIRSGISHLWVLSFQGVIGNWTKCLQIHTNSWSLKGFNKSRSITALPK